MNHVIKFNDNEVRNDFIKKIDMTQFKQKEVAALVGLSTGYVTYLINDVDRSITYPKVDIECPACGEIIKVIIRDDLTGLTSMRVSALGQFTQGEL